MLNIPAYGESVIDGKLHKATVCRRVHSTHTITISPFEYHSVPYFIPFRNTLSLIFAYVSLA